MVELPYDIDGVTVGAANGEAYTIFDPRWYVLHRWVWWYWMVGFNNGWQVLRHRARDVWARLRGQNPNPHPSVGDGFSKVMGLWFDYGSVDFRFNSTVKRVRIYRVRNQWVCYVRTFEE